MKRGTNGAVKFNYSVLKFYDHLGHGDADEYVRSEWLHSPAYDLEREHHAGVDIVQVGG